MAEAIPEPDHHSPPCDGHGTPVSQEIQCNPHLSDLTDWPGNSLGTLSRLPPEVRSMIFSNALGCIPHGDILAVRTSRGKYTVFRGPRLLFVCKTISAEILSLLHVHATFVVSSPEEFKELFRRDTIQLNINGFIRPAPPRKVRIQLLLSLEDSIAVLPYESVHKKRLQKLNRVAKMPRNPQDEDFIGWLSNWRQVIFLGASTLTKLTFDLNDCRFRIFQDAGPESVMPRIERFMLTTQMGLDARARYEGRTVAVSCCYDEDPHYARVRRPRGESMCHSFDPGSLI